MAYTSRQLIINAFYLSNIVARDLETVGGSQLEDGLFRLNAFLAMKGANTKMAPYYQVIEGNFVPNQEIYFFEGLNHIETITFFLENSNETSSVRFSMRESTREEYFAFGRVEGIAALPYQWHLERVKGGSNLYVYYLPDKPYPYQIVGKFNLDETSLNQDLSLVYDSFYLEYLMYGLADYLCEWYSVETPATVLQKMKDIENHMRTISPMDLTMRKLSYFTSASGFNYADPILGKGFRPLGR